MPKEQLTRKRKNSDPALNSRKAKIQNTKDSGNQDDYTVDSVFCQLLRKAGLNLKKGGHINTINADQAILQRSILLSLKRNENYPKVVDEFIEGFEEYIEDHSRFHYSLLPTATTPECDSARSHRQDCVIRILLSIDILQPKLMNCLLEKLAVFMDDDYCIFDHGEKVNLPKLLLNQFRWLDKIFSSKEVTDKMLEIIGIVPLEIQHEIIVCLPEIVEDIEQGEVAKALKDLLVHNQLTVPILDALSNLTLLPDLLSEVRGSVLQKLLSVDVEDLPVVIKFLHNSVNSQDASEVIAEMRANLDFKFGFSPPTSSTPYSTKERRGKNSDTSRESELLTLDAIRSGIRFQKCVADAWIKAIDAVKQPGDHKVVDIFVLLILHSTTYKKPVESIFRNKIRTGGFTEVLLQEAFGAHAQVLRDSFPSILSLSEVLLRSPEPAILYFACALYKKAFISFDRYCQQEIVGDLITHIGSGYEGEIDSSLDILAELVETHLSKVAPFAILLKSVLDYLDNLSVLQIKKLYSTLSLLAFRDESQGDLIKDDLHMLTRKQLSNNDPKYKRMGVILAIMIIKSLAYNSNGDSNVTQTDVSLSEVNYKEVVTLLQMVTTSSSHMPEATALFMDELAVVIGDGHLDPKVEAWISDNVLSDFQDDYVVDIEEIKEDDSCTVPFELKFGLDEENDGSIAINVLPLVQKSLLAKKKQPLRKAEDEKIPAPICLSPHFRLLQVCEKRQQKGELDNIDALLGCPILIAKPEVFDKLASLSQTEKEVVCETLFQGLNWFREVINAFATQNDLEMKAKVISRLQGITELQVLLEQCLAEVPGFKPPPVNFDWYECPPPKAPVPGAGEKKKKARKPGGKKNKNGKDVSPGNDSDEDSRDSTVMDKTTLADTQIQNKSPEQTDKPTICISNYRHFFRELDMSVFTILHTGVVTQKALDTDMNTKGTTDLSIQPRQLQFMLEDFTSKLNHSLIASTSKRRTFLKPKSGSKNIGFSHLDQHSPKQIAEKAVQLLPALCNHLEGASGFFQTMIAENDGLIDGPGSTGPEAVVMGTCFRLLLQALHCIFSWNGFLMAENRSLLKDGLKVLVSRIVSSGATQLGYQDLLKSAYQYVANFANTVPNLPTAVTTIQLLISFVEKSESEELMSKIVNMSEEYLKREWLGADGERDKGAKFNESLQFIIKTYLSYSEDSLSASETIATKGIPELVEMDKNGCSNTYPTLTRQSFSVFYRVMFNELIGCLKAIAPAKQSDSRELKLDKLLKWNQAVRILHILVNLVKVFDGRANLGAALKYGRQFIDIFLRQGMPLLDKMFRSNKEDVQGLLKNLQLSTRALHHMCTHSKIIKDIALTNQVPLLKKCLEAFVYRVKAMLTLNKCFEAFWLGNLKNRDLRGEEILSQISVVSEASTEQNDENNPDDDDVPDDEDEESEVEMDNQSEAGSDHTRENSDDEQSCSETF